MTARPREFSTFDLLADSSGACGCGDGGTPRLDGLVGESCASCAEESAGRLGAAAPDVVRSGGSGRSSTGRVLGARSGGSLLDPPDVGGIAGVLGGDTGMGLPSGDVSGLAGAGGLLTPDGGGGIYGDRGISFHDIPWGADPLTLHGYLHHVYGPCEDPDVSDEIKLELCCWPWLNPCCEVRHPEAYSKYELFRRWLLCRLQNLALLKSPLKFPPPWGHFYDAFGGGHLHSETFDCPPAIYALEDANVTEKDDEYGFLGSHRVFMPGDLDSLQENLIVFLPGDKGDPSEHDLILTAYAQAGFRTIGLHWNQYTLETARQTCENEVTDHDLNNCLEEERNRKLYEDVVPSLTTLLNNLAGNYPDEGWGGFALAQWPLFGPIWSKIVLAGYSEGANQTAYSIRVATTFGAILVSGGGDLGTVEGDPDVLADWMDDPDFQVNTAAEHIVGLRHVDEAYDYTEGWSASGMPETTKDAMARPAYDAYSLAHRLEYKKEIEGSEAEVKVLAHQSTHVDEELLPAHMYLACKAGMDA